MRNNKQYMNKRGQCLEHPHMKVSHIKINHMTDNLLMARMYFIMKLNVTNVSFIKNKNILSKLLLIP